MKHQIKQSGDQIILSRICKITNQEYSVTITEEQYEELTSSKRRLIQEILPDFTPEQREFLISGYTPDEWNTYFKEY